MKKKPTSYIIWGLAIVPVILSVALWIFLWATRQPCHFNDTLLEEAVPEPLEEVNKAVIYVGDNEWWENNYTFPMDSCTVEGSFRADTLVIISNDKGIIFYNYD